ncbi:MAG TPA: tyrosinase family protein [Allosphingosinicella sp.]|jgi:tyrosinase
MITRRRTLQSLTLGGVAVFAGVVPGTRLLAQPLPRRREINGLALNDPMVQTLRDGVRILKARTAGQGPSWSDLCAIHGSLAGGFNKCPHGNWYFLPWHRAYLLMYERMIRSVTSNNAFAMPYWDWAANRTVPQAFKDANFNGQPNPLFVANRNNAYSIPDTYSGPSVMTNIFGQTNFELFGSSRPAGQNNLNASWIKAGGTQGTLEATPHNNIHVRLGGFMPNGNSPMDPIFLMHHGNIDRIWWSWNCRGGANTTDPLWRNMPFTNNYFNPNGTMATFKPSDLLSVSALGYSYGLCLTRLPHFVIRDLADLRLASIFRAGSAVRANVAGAQLLRVQARPSGATLEAVGAATPRSLRTTFSNLTARPQALQVLRADQRTSQIVALIHDLTPPTDEVEVLVFAGTGELRPTADERDPSFVTSIGFFGAHAHGHDGVSASVDLTEHLRRIGANSDEVHVRLVARPTGQSDAAVQETVARAQVEVVIV